MPRINSKPIPKKRYHGGRWRIFWKYKGKQYGLATTFFDKKKQGGVDSDLRVISAALTMDTPVFPPEYQESPAVRKYLEDRYGKPDMAIESIDDWEEEYIKEIRSVCTPMWSRLCF